MSRSALADRRYPSPSRETLVCDQGLFQLEKIGEGTLHSAWQLRGKLWAPVFLNEILNVAPGFWTVKCTPFKRVFLRGQRVRIHLVGPRGASVQDLAHAITSKGDGSWVPKLSRDSI